MKAKKLIAMLLSATLAFTMVACGSDSGNATETSTDTTSTTTEGETTASTAEDTITIMVPPVTNTFVELLRTVWIPDFQEMYPHISFDVIETSWDDHSTKLTTMALAGEAPDIVQTGYGRISSLVEMGVAIDVEQYLADGVLADYDQAALDYMTVEGTLYGLPLYITVQALGGNLEMLEAAGADVEKIQAQGWSYDEFLEILEAGTTSDTYGFAFANANNTTADFIGIFGTAAGISNKFTSDLKFAYTSANMLALLESVETLIGSGYMPDYALEASQRLVMLQTGEAMIIGKAMPLFEESMNLNNVAIEEGSGEEVPGSIQLEYVFLPTPTMDGVVDTTFGSVDGFVALRNGNTTDERLENVCLFMNYITSGERAAALYETLYLTCVTESGREAQVQYELDQTESNAVATERAIATVVAPPTGVSAELDAASQTVMDETVVPKFQALIAGEISAQDMYDAICQHAFSVMGEENCETDWVK
ncbi:MAG: extracellular solute-binding protein [Eubacteriales bacterium]